LSPVFKINVKPTPDFTTGQTFEASSKEAKDGPTETAEKNITITEDINKNSKDANEHIKSLATAIKESLEKEDNFDDLTMEQ